MEYIQKGIEAGARIATGGKRFNTHGRFIEPTIFEDVTDDMEIAKDEIFGPVMCLFKFKTDDEVLFRNFIF